MMEERARLRAQGVTNLPHVPDGAVPSLEAARAALDKFQTDRMATLGSVSEPLARAQEQLAALEASLDKVNAQTPLYETEAYKRALQARMGKYSNGAMADPYADHGGKLSVADACLTQSCLAGFYVNIPASVSLFSKFG